MAPVTDPVLIRELIRQGINPADVDFDQDYAPRSLGKRHSPYAKFYSGLLANARGKQWMVVSGLSMVDCDGVKCEPKWVQTGNTYHTKSNVFAGLVNDIPGRITLTVKNDDAVGRKKNDRLVFISQLFLNGAEVPRPNAVLLPVDPLNSNYLENTIEWDYGICKRRLRQIERCVLGSWVFPSNPNGEVRVKYNQTGDYRLKLGQFAIDADTEVIPKSVFDGVVYPFTVSDSATYYPDANPETTSVDGWLNQQYGLGSGVTWANLIAAAGNNATDSDTALDPVYITEDNVNSRWRTLNRAITLFDTSGLPDAAVISAATLSLYGRLKANGHSYSPAPDINVYPATPASNTALVAGDYDSIGPLGAETPFCDTPITYANWLIADPFWNNFALNAAGIAAIPKSPANACAKFGFRNANYDAAAVSPTYSGSWAAETYLFAWAAEKGNGFKPKLVVTYSLSQKLSRGIVDKMMAAGAI